MTAQEKRERKYAIFMGACILVRDPDGKDNLFRRDSISRAAMQVAVHTSKMLLDITEDELVRGMGKP